MARNLKLVPIRKSESRITGGNWFIHVSGRCKVRMKPEMGTSLETLHNVLVNFCYLHEETNGDEPTFIKVFYNCWPITYSIDH